MAQWVSVDEIKNRVGMHDVFAHDNLLQETQGK